MLNKALSLVITCLFLSSQTATALTLPATTAPVLPIEHWVLSNGANVYFVPEHQLPMVDMEVLFNAGSAQDADHFGVANFTNSMIGEGAQDLSADEIANIFDSLGALFDTNCARDTAQLSLRTLTDPPILEKASNTFAHILTQPSFGTANFSRVKNQLLQAILEEEQTPSVLADNAFYSAIYGTHPYAHDPLGNTATVKRLTPNDLMTFYRSHYVGMNATVAIVGDLSSKQALKLSKKIVGDLPAGTLPAPLPALEPLSQQTPIHIDYPSTQTFIRIGQLGIQRNDPAYFSLYVGNYILGGGQLVSQLFKTVRDQHGLTYNINSYFIPMQEQGPFITALQTRNNNTREAITLTKEVIQHFIAQGPSTDELTAAKKNITGGFPLLFSSNANIVDLVALIGFYHLPLTYLDDYRDRINAVTSEDVKTAFNQQLNVDKMSIVTVGEATHV